MKSKQNQKKKRTSKYDAKVSIKGSFQDAIKALMKQDKNIYINISY